MATAFQTNTFQSNAFQLTVHLLSLTDGITLGDATVYLFEINPALTDGSTFGDTPVSLASFMSLATDGIKLGEGHKLSFQSDGFQNNAFQITGMPYYTYYILLVATDRTILGDTSSTATIFEVVLGEEGQETFQLNAFQSNAFQATGPAAGIRLGDTPLTASEFQSILTDGIKLGEGFVSFQDDAFQSNAFNVISGPVYEYIINLFGSDGVKLGEAVITQNELQSILTDGIKLGDTIHLNFAHIAVQLTLKRREVNLSLWKR